MIAPLLLRVNSQFSLIRVVLRWWELEGEQRETLQWTQFLCTCVPCSFIYGTSPWELLLLRENCYCCFYFMSATRSCTVALLLLWEAWLHWITQVCHRAWWRRRGSVCLVCSVHITDLKGTLLHKNQLTSLSNLGTEHPTLSIRPVESE